jgi:hypothetical protein
VAPGALLANPDSGHFYIYQSTLFERRTNHMLPMQEESNSRLQRIGNYASSNEAHTTFIISSYLLHFPPTFHNRRPRILRVTCTALPDSPTPPNASTTVSVTGG